MSQGFGKQKKQTNPVGEAVGVLYRLSAERGQPVVVLMYPEGSDRGLLPEETKPGLSELAPTCDGLVFAVQCSADDAQELFDLVHAWEAARRERESDRHD